MSDEVQKALALWDSAFREGLRQGRLDAAGLAEASARGVSRRAMTRLARRLREMAE